MAPFGFVPNEWVARRDVPVRSQPKDFSEEHIQGLRIQHIILVAGGDAATAISDADVEKAIVPEGNVAGIVRAVGHDGGVEEDLLGITIDLEIFVEDEARETIDGSVFGIPGCVAVAELVLGIIQINVPIAVPAELWFDSVGFWLDSVGLQ